jgi:hypothetical protein
MRSMAEANFDRAQSPILTSQRPRNPTRSEIGSSPEQERLSKINTECQRLLAAFPPDVQEEKARFITDVFGSLGMRLSVQEGFEFGELQRSILKLKLVRHLQKNDTLDAHVLFDAVIESPKFINVERGSLNRLLEVHQQKTLQEIAEIRRRRADMGNPSELNPYENLFTTKSGNYYVARLLNMPHLEAESEYMNHCVGTENSYINRMKRGEIEIFSFRWVPTINPQTDKLEGDTPIITIEYNLKTKVIEQMKKKDDEYLSSDDPYFDDVVDALRQLRTTTTDTGKLRDFTQISESESENIEVKDYHVLTDHGEVPFREFKPDSNTFVLKMGSMKIAPETSRENVAKIVRIVKGIDCKPEDIAQNLGEVTPNTKVYIGKLSPGFFRKLPDHVTHIYTEFPENKITRDTVTIGTDKQNELYHRISQNGVHATSMALELLKIQEFKTEKKLELVTLILLSVKDLGLNVSSSTINDIYKRARLLGLDLCPAETGPQYFLKLENQHNGMPVEGRILIGMKPIGWIDDFDGDGPAIFAIDDFDDTAGLYLSAYVPSPKYRWRDIIFAFNSHKAKPGLSDFFAKFRTKRSNLNE